MKKVFLLQANGDRYQSVRADVPPEEYQSLHEVPSGGAWSAPPLYVRNPLLPRADFLRSVEFGIVCPSSLVRTHPESLIARDCDLYPCRIDVETQEYVVFRPKHVWDEKTLFEPDIGSPRKLRRSAFSESTLFRTSPSTTAIYAAVADDSAGEDLLLFFRQHRGIDLQLIAEDAGL